MTFALSAYRASGVNLQGPTRKRGYQRLVFEITATVADVTLDLGTFSAGTFWAAVSASALGASALASVQRIVGNAASLIMIGSEQLIDRIQVAGAPADGQWRVTSISNHLPNLAFNAGNGKTSWVIAVELELNDGIYPVTENYG